MRRLLIGLSVFFRLPIFGYIDSIGLNEYTAFRQHLVEILFKLLALILIDSYTSFERTNLKSLSKSIRWNNEMNRTSD